MGTEKTPPATPSSISAEVEKVERRKRRKEALMAWAARGLILLAGAGGGGTVGSMGSADEDVVREITEQRLGFEEDVTGLLEGLAEENRTLRAELENLRADVNRSKAQFTDLAVSLARASGRPVTAPAPERDPPRARAGSLQEKVNALAPAPADLKPMPAPAAKTASVAETIEKLTKKRVAERQLLDRL